MPTPRKPRKAAPAAFAQARAYNRQISIDAENAEFLAALGKGNLSAGIRRAAWVLRGRARCPVACKRNMKWPGIEPAKSVET